MAKYSKSDFFALLGPIVDQVRGEGSPLFPSVRLAQNWLETGGSIPSWNNLAGYKVGSGKPTAYWDGSSVNTATKEVYNGVEVRTSANWRAYKTLYDFYKDQDLLLSNTRYDRVRAAITPEAQCQALQACGYATDPNYASLLISIIKSNELKKYDVPATFGQSEDEEKLKLSEYQWGVVATNVESLLKRKVITDSTWLDKAKNKTMTTSDLAWLTFVIANK